MRFPSFLTLALSLAFCLALPSFIFAQLNPSCPTELDGDGTVGMTDLLIVLADFGTVCEPDPPPSSWPLLHFTELHYNPATAQGSDSDFEFLELYNPHAFEVDLSGWSLSEGLNYAFPDGTAMAPGEYLVVAANAITYAGLGYPVYDWGSGGLHNSGELLAIRAPDGTVVESVVYSDTGEWDTAPDGQGPSLERLFLDGDPHDAGQWTASIATGGSPGAINSVWVD
jgi:hypothetical protein